ncbi:alpha/beta hydrolase [uncultured Shewanella sp.]|uniref:alpha/beta hydrolase n=1 Tax=uncultured Shewanella sp. TaxID=173975 RepID=UPI00260BB039|nr:alpha/beta hydrolase [uncultured Shewanella sp.]
MNKLVVISIFLLVIFFIVILSMIVIPVKRENPVNGLDFNVLDTPPLGDVGSIDSQYFARDGKALFYRHVKGSHDLIFVLLHGSGTEGRYLLPLATQLNQQLRATVVIPDLRGHGRSMLSHPGDIDYIGQYEHDLADLHHRLEKQYPDATIILAGHSSGGGLAVKYAGHALIPKDDDVMKDKAQYLQAPFDAYVLLAPYLGHDAPTVRPNSGGWVQVSIRRIIGLSLLNQLGIRQFNHLPILFFNRPEAVNDSLQLDSYSYRLNVSFSPTDYQAQLQHNLNPVLLLVGEEDEAFYAEKFPDVMQAHAPQAEVYLLPKVQHLNLPDAPEVIEKIAHWLSMNVLSQQ